MQLGTIAVTYLVIFGCLMFLRLNLDDLPTYPLLEYNEAVKITSK